MKAYEFQFLINLDTGFENSTKMKTFLFVKHVAIHRFLQLSKHIHLYVVFSLYLHSTGKELKYAQGKATHMYNDTVARCYKQHT